MVTQQMEQLYALLKLMNDLEDGIVIEKAYIVRQLDSMYVKQQFKDVDYPDSMPPLPPARPLHTYKRQTNRTPEELNELGRIFENSKDIVAKKLVHSYYVLTTEQQKVIKDFLEAYKEVPDGLKTVLEKYLTPLSASPVGGQKTPAPSPRR